MHPNAKATIHTCVDMLTWWQQCHGILAKLALALSLTAIFLGQSFQVCHECVQALPSRSTCTKQNVVAAKRDDSVYYVTTVK